MAIDGILFGILMEKTCFIPLYPFVLVSAFPNAYNSIAKPSRSGVSAHSASSSSLPSLCQAYYSLQCIS